MGNFSAIIEDNARRDEREKTASIVKAYRKYNNIDMVVRELKYSKAEVIRILKEYGFLDEETPVSEKDVPIPESLKDDYGNDL